MFLPGKFAILTRGFYGFLSPTRQIMLEIVP